MSRPSDLCTATLVEVATLVKHKKISPVELAEAMLARIQRLDAKLHSYITVTDELALQQARTAERDIDKGEYRGPLHGIPIGIKDVFCTQGIRTTGAATPLRNWVPDYNATVVEKLSMAGAVFLGKQSLTEWSFGGYPSWLAAPVNPWGSTFWTGESSSGSGVATAAGLCFGALGTDAGGSIRYPSSCNGIVGLKPSLGRVSQYGCLPVTPSLCVIGPMARSVADTAVLLQVIAGFDIVDPISRREAIPNYLREAYKGVNGMRIGIDAEYCTTNVDPQVSGAVLATTSIFKQLGATVREVKLEGLTDAKVAWRAIIAAEMAVAYHRHYSVDPSAFNPILRAFLAKGYTIRGTDCARAYAEQQLWRRRLEKLYEDIDLLLCPIMLRPFPQEDFSETHAEEMWESILTYQQFSGPFNLAGTPSIVVPCGSSDQGMPLALQLVGRYNEEATVLRAAHAYEQATEWHTKRPPVG